MRKNSERIDQLEGQLDACVTMIDILMKHILDKESASEVCAEIDEQTNIFTCGDQDWLQSDNAIRRAYAKTLCIFEDTAWAIEKSDL